MRILRLTARLLPYHPGAASAAEVAKQFAATLRAQHERGVAHVVVSRLGPELVELAVFLHSGAPDAPEVGSADGWVVDPTQPCDLEPW
jgi:hypothetical protein